MDYVTVTLPGGRSYRWDMRTDLVRIGRASHNDLILEDPGVSRDHAQIARGVEGVILQDRGGKNGTFLNGWRITGPALIHEGDTIRVGSTTIVFNGAMASPVEFVDSPLPAGGATTVLRAREVVTGGGIPSLSSQETDARGVTPATGSTSLAGAASGAFALSPALSVIWEADKELVFHRPLPEILERTVDLVAKAVPFDRALLMLEEQGRLVSRVVRIPRGEEGEKIPISRTIADRVLKRQESVLTDDAMSDERFAAGQSVVAQQIRSAMCVPLYNNQEVIGLIYIDSRRRAGLFKEDDLRLLTHLANVAAVKIENVRLFEQRVQAERMEQEMRKAAEIQRLLLPACSPPIRGYTLHGSSEPCRVVGGDLFDYVDLPGGRLGVSLGDVAGKGYSAALLMTAFQASMRALCELGDAPDTTMGRLNRLLCKRFPENRFVTFFYADLDPARHVVTYVNAGHCPPWVIRRDGSVESLEATGGPLGLFTDMRYESGTTTLSPGEVMVCYSDGVTDAIDPSGEQYGTPRLLDLVKSLHEKKPEEIVESITTAISAHYEGGVREDDLTLVVLKRDE